MAAKFDAAGTHIVKLIHQSAKPLYDELLDCVSHFPWEELTEGWFQFGLVRSLYKAGYHSYPEYHLENLSGGLSGKVDIAVFAPRRKHESPYAFIEVKAVGSSVKAFRYDASRLARCAELGVVGTLVYFSSAVSKTEAEKECRDIKRVCMTADATPLLRCDRHNYEQRQYVRLKEHGLQSRHWIIFTATFAPMSQSVAKPAAT
jgi:hypothetical protein